MAESVWIIPFERSKFKGVGIEDCPLWYLKWLTEQEWFCQNFANTALKLVQAEIIYKERFEDEKENS